VHFRHIFVEFTRDEDAKMPLERRLMQLERRFDATRAKGVALGYTTDLFSKASGIEILSAAFLIDALSDSNHCCDYRFSVSNLKKYISNGFPWGAAPPIVSAGHCSQNHSNVGKPFFVLPILSASQMVDIRDPLTILSSSQIKTTVD
jgi:hypothetical protein